MRKCLLAVAAFLCFAVATSQASAFVVNKKVALVIGNSDYEHAITLPNPVRDGTLIGETLRKSGFEVIEGTNLGKVDMGRLLDEFTEAAYDADIAVVYYAGHGLQVDGHNYLIPVDAELEKASQLQTRTIPVEDVLAALPPDPAVGVVILDACRDNPLARTLAAALPKSRSMGNGLAPVQASGLSHDAGGLLIAYATDPGAVAYDGTGEHSPYTTALARHLTIQGLEIQSALTRVRAEVSEATNGAQRPWHNASLAREVYIGSAPQAVAEPVAPEQPVAKTNEPAGEGVDWTVEQKLWDEASKRNTIAHYELYLSQFPEGRFAAVARLNLDQLKETQAASTAVASPPAQTESVSRASETVDAPAAAEAAQADLKADDGATTAKTETAVSATPTEAAPATTPAKAAALDTDDNATASAEEIATAPAPGPAGENAAAAPAAEKPQQFALNTAPVPKAATAVSDEARQLPGTPESEAAIMLDRDGRIDLQLRLTALGHYDGAFDGSIGPRSRKAIGAWQQKNGIVESTYLTPEQHMFLVAQSDPVVAEVRAEYEAQKAAWIAQQEARKKPQTVQKATKPLTKTAAKRTTTTKKKQVATKTTTTRRKATQQAASDEPTYRPRNKTTERPNDGAANWGGGVGAGLLLGTGIGLAIGSK